MKVTDKSKTAKSKRSSSTMGVKILKGIKISTPRKPKSLLEAIDNINFQLSECVRDTERFEDLDLSLCYGNNIDYLAKRLNITPLQAVVFSVCIETGPSEISFRSLSQDLRLSKAQALKLIDPLNELVRCRLLGLTRCYNSPISCYSVPGRVLKSLISNQDYIAPQRKCEDTLEFLKYYRDFCCELEEEGVKQGLLIEEIEDMFNDNPDLEFVQKVNGFHLNSINRMLLVHFCQMLVLTNNKNLGFWQLENLFPDKGQFFREKSQLSSGQHDLMAFGLIEFTCDNGIADTSRFSLTEKARTELLASINLNAKEEKLSGVTHAEDIHVKELYYSEKVSKQVGKLKNFLDPKKFQFLVEVMKDQFNRCGLTCLMYGGPGTGKTETVYQLARQTGRDIMAIEVPQIKSKWVGDSEKNIKAVFDKYREMVENAQVAPILLFNEADAIIGIRKSGADKAVDKMENAIQNIILQEMENLNGIMIATTNLTENLDSAFERRFLYKIEFEQPDAGVRENIWQKMIPLLNSEECKALAEGFDFSGGQIENVARKFTIDNILGEYINKDILTELTTLCNEEYINDSMANRRRIGFVA